jgi:3',5'-cyclic AMP phosphodiesterase CpdA
MTTRLAHFSDVHVSANPLGWRRADYFNKRLTGWANLRFLGRAKHFHYAAEVLAAMMADIDKEKPDHLVFSGDATGLGFENELAGVAGLMTVGAPGAVPGIAVPGNHDYYIAAEAVSGRFEQYFDAWQQGERVDGHRYPFAQSLDSFWLVAINSSTANRGPIDASGAVGAEQLARLETLMKRLSLKPRILITHYPICLADGQMEKRLHGLRDLPQVLDVLRGKGICLWLHGHRHHAYWLQHPPGADFPVICSGSATQHGRASYGLYDINRLVLRGHRRRYSDMTHTFEDAEQFELHLPW